MALSITQTPQYISPTSNPIIFKVEDDNVNVVFFRVIVREVGTNEILGVHKIFKTPTSSGNFVDVSLRLRDLTFTEIDNETTMYAKMNGAVNYYLDIMSIGRDGSVIGDVLTTQSYWAYNGGGGLVSSVGFDVTDWYMNLAQVGVKYADFLTSKPTISNVFTFQKDMFYFLADENSGVDRLLVNVYDKGGNLIKAIDEPIVITNSNILHRIYLQPNTLALSYNFDVTKVDKIVFWLADSNGTQVSKVRTSVISNSYSCSYDKVNMLWENEQGGIDTFTFVNPKETKTVNRQIFKGNGYVESIANVYKSVDSVVDLTYDSVYSMTTLPLTDSEYKTISNILTSRNTYVELSDGSVWGVLVNDTSVNVRKRKYEQGALRYNLSFKSLSNLDIISRGEVLVTDDPIPSAVVFNDVNGAEFNQTYTSNTVTISGINVTIPISVVGGEYKVNGGVWTTNRSIVNVGDEVTVRITTKQQSLQNYNVTLTLGTYSTVWNVTTKAIVSTPNTVTFTAQTGVELNTQYQSNVVTIAGINVPIPISVTNGGYSKNGGNWVSGVTTSCRKYR